MSDVKLAGPGLILPRSSKSAKSKKDEKTRPTAPPERPPPPIVGKVTHHSIELYWEEALTQANQCSPKGDSRVRVTIQEQDKTGGWGTVYTGYSSRHTLTGLEIWTRYRYRIRFMNDQGNSEWSPSIEVSTTKEPFSGEHLNKAVLKLDLTELNRILDSGEVQVDTPDKYGFSPLMQASQKGLIDMVETLLSKGADVNFQNDSGKTSLMLACYAGKLESVKELRHNSASYNLQDKGGSTALHWAMDKGDTELIEWLIEDGADIHMKDYNGWTPLHRVAAVGGHKDAAALLIKHGAHLNLRDKDGKTVLMIAVVNGHQGLVELLLESGADLTVQNEYGKTAYEMATSMEKRRVIKTLEEHMDKHGIKYF